MILRSLFEILIQSSMPGKETTLTCDECFVVLEYFVDLALEGFTLEEIKKPLLKHIDHCPECQEHHLGRLREIEEHWMQSQNPGKPA